MSNTAYNKESVISIVEYASLLINKSLAEAVMLPPDIVNKKNKGSLGLLTEKYYFEINPPNNHAPDFPDALTGTTDFSGHNFCKGLELKTTGVTIEPNGIYKAKERLVLTMIDYEAIVDETWDNSAFVKKCRLMLILFYLYEKETEVINRKFVLTPILYELEIPGEDRAQIEKDWKHIQKMVRDGKAHELSEGSTSYLRACRKGAGMRHGEKQVKQPRSADMAKSRAFSFKPSYITSLIAEHNSSSVDNVVEEN